MKLSGFRVHRPWPRVEVWELCETRIQLRDVIKNRVVSVTSRPDPTFGRAFDTAWLAANSEPMAFRMPDGETRRLPRAHIVTMSFSDAADFLLAAWVPQADRPIDAVVRRAAAGAPADATRRELSGLLWQAPMTRVTSHTREGGDGLVLLSPSEFPLLWCSPHASEYHPGLRFMGAHDELVFDRAARFLLTCSIELSIHGRPVPRAAWVPVGPGVRLAADGYWDGHRVRAASTLLERSTAT